jgi:predicted transposase YbfD/YdcC
MTPFNGLHRESNFLALIPQSAVRFARLVRGHWGGGEIRNHWVRDALFEEDATRSKNLNLNGNLAVLRCALIALKSRHASQLSWPTIFELSGLKPAVPYNLVCNNTLK